MKPLIKTILIGAVSTLIATIVYERFIKPKLKGV